MRAETVEDLFVIALAVASLAEISEHELLRVEDAVGILNHVTDVFDGEAAADQSHQAPLAPAHLQFQDAVIAKVGRASGREFRIALLELLVAVLVLNGLPMVSQPAARESVELDALERFDKLIPEIH